MAKRDCGGCSACDDYRCEWLKGYGDEEDRPDDSGVLVDRLFAGKPVPGAVVAHALEDGAELTQEGQAALCNISERAMCPVLVLDPHGELLSVGGRGVQ